MAENIVTPPEAAPRSRPSLGALLQSRDFRFLWIAWAATGTADFFTYVALAWVTLDLTHSAPAVAGVLTVQTVSRVAVLLFGGALVDRESPRSVMLQASLGRTLLNGAIFALIALRLFSAWELVPAALLLGVVGGLFMPARGSALPAIVGKELLEAGNGALQVTAQAAGIVGPLLAGVVVAWRGSGAAFFVDAFAYLVAAVAVWLIHSGRAATGAGADARRRSGPRQMLADVVEGVRSVWSDVPLRTVILVISLINFCSSGPIDVGLPVMARFAWGGAQSLGLVLGCFGVGAAAGAVVVGALRRRPQVGVTVISICVWLGLGLAAFGLLNAWGAAVDGALIGVGIGFANVIGISWIQRRAQAGLIGRVMALLTVGATALTPFSMALAAPLIAFSPTLLFVASGGLLVLTGIGCAASRSLRTT